MSHWAMSYIGAPYQLGASGEEGYFDCWGLVRHVHSQQYQHDLPPIVPDTANATSFIRAFKNSSEYEHWQVVDSIEQALEGDCVLLTQARYPHHIGLWVIAGDESGILHAVEGAGVVFQPLYSLKLSGWKVAGIYRHVRHV